MSRWLRAVPFAGAFLLMFLAGPSLAQESPVGLPQPSLDGEAKESDAIEPTTLVSARLAIEEARYTEALDFLAAALLEGVATPEQLQEIYRLQGETQVAVGKAQLALDAFKRLLVLAPEASLGEFVSPKIMAVLDSARKELAGVSLQLRHELDSEASSCEVIVESDPLAMATQVQLAYRRQDGSSARLNIELKAAKATFDLPKQASGQVHLALLDSDGNVLLAQAVDLPVARATMVAVPPLSAVPTHKQPIWETWWVWAGAGATVAVAGSAFGISSSSAQSDLDQLVKKPEEYFYSDAQRLEDKAVRRAKWANLSFALAGAFGIASGVMYWRSQNTEASLQVAPAVEGSGASVLLGGRF